MADTLGRCMTPNCGAQATVVNEFPGERFEWCDWCAADIERQCREVRGMINAAQSLERAITGRQN